MEEGKQNRKENRNKNSNSQKKEDIVIEINKKNISIKNLESDFSSLNELNSCKPSNNQFNDLACNLLEEKLFLVGINSAREKQKITDKKQKRGKLVSFNNNILNSISKEQQKILSNFESLVYTIEEDGKKEEQKEENKNFLSSVPVNIINKFNSNEQKLQNYSSFTDEIYKNIENLILMKIQNEKNVTFYCIGEESKSNFFFGSTNYFIHDSFLFKSFNLIIKEMEKQEKFDIILIDYLKFQGEKFLLDYRNLQFNFQVELIDYLNFISASEVDPNSSCSTVLVFKFFKFTNSDDLSKTEREVSLVQSVSYINLEAYDFETENEKEKENENDAAYNREEFNDFSLMQKKNKKKLNPTQKFFNLISSISQLNIDLFLENNFIDSPIHCNTLKQPFSSFFTFYFLPEEISFSDYKIFEENIVCFKKANFEYFFDYGNFNYEQFQNENFYSKQEFYLLERIVSNFLILILKSSVKFFKD